MTQGNSLDDLAVVLHQAGRLASLVLVSHLGSPLGDEASKLAHALSDARAKALRDVVHYKQAGDDACGVADPYPYDIQCRAALERFKALGGSESEANKAIRGGTS